MNDHESRTQNANLYYAKFTHASRHEWRKFVCYDDAKDWAFTRLDGVAEKKRTKAKINIFCGEAMIFQASADF